MGVRKMILILCYAIWYVAILNHIAWEEMDEHHIDRL